MKTLILTLALASSLGVAQTVDVNDVDTTSEENTTIEITKGKKMNAGQTKWEIVDGAAPISGEPSPMERPARDSWKKACADWKKELKEDNKENMVMSAQCGEPTCTGSAGQKICSSTGQFKLKTKIVN